MKKKQKYVVSAVVPVYNGEMFIAETLDSLLAQKRKFDEIIVVDDGSTDSTVDIVKTFKNVKLIRSQHVERIAVRNIGWKAAKGNIIAFIDSDLVLVKDWLIEVLKGFDKGYPAVVDRRAVYKPKTYIAKLNDHFFDLRYNDNYKPFTLWIIKRDLLEKVNGLDEHVIAFEDIDLADRVFAEGHDIYLAKKAIAYHHGEPVSLREEFRRAFWFGSHAWNYWRKTGKLKKIIRGIIFVGATVMTPFFPLYVLGFLLFCYLFVFVKDVRRGMKLKYLFVHPFIGVINEFVYAYGALYGLFFGPIVFARKRAADAGKVSS
jgi:glycosyltransferase involved in cell wall biosynthesis